MPRNDVDSTVVAIERLVNIFRLERYVYLSVTLFSVLLLLICILTTLLKGEAGTGELVGMMSSSGGIMYTAGRLLAMFDKALRVLSNVAENVQELG